MGKGHLQTKAHVKNKEKHYKKVKKNKQTVIKL